MLTKNVSHCIFPEKIRSFGLICQSFIFLIRRDYLFPNQFFKDDRFSPDGFPTIRLSHSVLVE